MASNVYFSARLIDADPMPQVPRLISSSANTYPILDYVARTTLVELLGENKIKSSGIHHELGSARNCSEREQISFIFCGHFCAAF